MLDLTKVAIQEIAKYTANVLGAMLIGIIMERKVTRSIQNEIYGMYLTTYH